MDLSKLLYYKREGNKELKETPPISSKPVQPAIGIQESHAVPEGYEKSEPTLDTDIVFIISGGEKRERDYFHLVDNPSIRRIKIAFVSKEHQGMNPSQMKVLAKKSISSHRFITPQHTYTINKDDTLYLLSDVDEFKADLMKEIVDTYTPSQIQWIISNPAFEIWLYYHYNTQPYPTLKEGKTKTTSELSQWLKHKISKLHESEGGVNPIKAFEHIRTAIQNSRNNYKEECGFPILFSTQMHILAQRIVDSMGDELDNLIRQRAEKARAFRQQHMSLSQQRNNVSEEKKHRFIQRLAEYAREYQLQLPSMNKHYTESLTEEDVKAFVRSYKVEKSYFDIKSPLVESNLTEVIINEIKQDVEHYYRTLFLLQTPVQTFTIDFSEIKDTFDFFGLDKDYEVLSGFSLDTYDTLYGGRYPFEKHTFGYKYGDVVIEKVNLHERCLYLMAKEFVPRAETKLNESGNENFDLTIPEKKIYSNVNHLQEMPDGFGISVMRVVRYYLPNQVNFRYIKLNVVDYHLEKSELSKLTKGELIKLRYDVGDIIRIKDTYRNLYKSVLKNRMVFEIWGINDDGTVNLDMVDTHVPYSHIEPVRIDGVSDKDIYYDPFVAASFIAPGETPPVHYTDYSYYLEHFKRNTFEGEEETLYDLCVSQKFRYVHEIQHWLRDVYGWDRLMINYGIGD